MSLTTVFESLAHDLSRDLPRNTRSFAEARLRRSEIAPFETLAALRAALDPASNLEVTARRRLVSALVAEAQAQKPTVASALLILAFAPMLHGLRRRISHAKEDPDLDSAILVAFTGAVRSVRPSSYASLALRWATLREVLTAQRSERTLGKGVPFDEEAHSPSPPPRSGFDETVEDVVRSLAADGSAEILEVLIATRGSDESLRAYVERTCPNRSARRARYAQLYRARRRFERELRQRLGRRAA